jgi:hypothetical protein
VAIQDQHDARGASDLAASSGGQGLGAKGASRRRFAKAAGAGAGVILTLASQPGMATEVCASPSQSLSLAHSGKPGAIVACSGRSPGYWKNNEAWPGGVDRNSTLFGAVFSCGYGSDYAKTTMLKMCSPCDFDKFELGAHITATYLNVLSGLINFLTLQDVKDIWYEVSHSGVYKPSAGVIWQPYQLVDYLKKTMS